MNTSHLEDGARRHVLRGARALDSGFPAFALNDNRVVSGAPLPYARGVVLAMGFDEDGEAQVSLHLLLPQGEVGVAFHTARHDFDVIALWRGLGRDFNLPLYLRSEAGELSALVPELGETSFSRRVGSPLSNRRPRFLARRRMPLAAHAMTLAPRQAKGL